MHKYNVILAAVIGGTVMLFALQNLSVVEVTFLFWTFQTKRYLIILFSVLAGLIVGLALGYSASNRRRVRDV